MDIDEQILNAVRDGIRDGVKKKFSEGYNSPLDTVLKAAMAKHAPACQAMLESAIAGCVDDPAFRDDIAEATRKVLAKTLVQRFGGEIEKQVNALKSNPTTRARITIALEDLVKSAGT